MVDRWHYTVGQRWEQIRASGVIRLATALVPKGERPVVWFTRRETWEPTATTLMQGPDGNRHDASDLEIKVRLGGKIRIGVAPETAPHSFAAFRRLSGIDPRFADGLAVVAREHGSDAEDWFVSFDPVPASAWLRVEWWFGGAWQPVQGWAPVRAERETAVAE